MNFVKFAEPRLRDLELNRDQQIMLGTRVVYYQLMIQSDWAEDEIFMKNIPYHEKFRLYGYGLEMGYKCERHLLVGFGCYVGGRAGPLFRLRFLEWNAKTWQKVVWNERYG